MASTYIAKNISIVDTTARNKESLVFTKKLEKGIQRLSNGLSSTKAGALIQVWMPEVSSRGRVLLSTEGLPFSISGVGDLLALFRCISCKYRFDTDPTYGDTMGAIGRVYYYGKPEMCLDVQQYDKSIYLRISEAQLCRIHSTVILPVFDSVDNKPAAVVELSHHDKDTEFTNIIQACVDAFKEEGLRTTDIDVDDWKLQLRKWPVDVCAVPLNSIEDTNLPKKHPYEQSISPMHVLGQAMQTGFGHVSEFLMSMGMDSLTSQDQSLDGFFTKPYCDFQHHITAAGNTAAADVDVPQAASAVISRCGSDSSSANTTQCITSQSHDCDKPKESLPSACQASVPAASEADQDEQSDSLKQEKITHDDERDHTDDDGMEAKKKENRLAGGAGKRLSYKDLEAHFGHGLKDAARRLGICPTTLKRACRRNGITRWPSRQISKLLKVWKQMGYKGEPPSWLLQNAISGSLRSENLAYILSAGLHVGLNPQRYGSHNNNGTSHHRDSNNNDGLSLKSPMMKTDFGSSSYCTSGHDNEADNAMIFDEDMSLKNFTHHGAYTAALHGTDESVFGYHEHSGNARLNHTWHGGQMANVILHPSSLPFQSEASPPTIGIVPNHSAIQFNPELNQMKQRERPSTSTTVCDLERTQRGGNGILPAMTEYAPSMDTEEFLLQTFQLPLAYDTSQNLFH